MERRWSSLNCAKKNLAGGVLSLTSFGAAFAMAAFIVSGLLSSLAAATADVASTRASGVATPRGNVSTAKISAPSTGVSIGADNDTVAMANASNGISSAGTSITVSADDSTSLQYGYTLSTRAVNSSDLASGSNKIVATAGTRYNPSDLTAGTWGYRLSDTAEGKYIGITSSDQSIKSTNSISGTSESTTVTFAVNTLSGLSAGTYSTQIQYTVTANLPPATVLDVAPNSSYTSDTAPTTSTIYGTNLNSVNSVYVDLNDNGMGDANEFGANLKVTSDDNTTLTFDAPLSNVAGQYNVYVISASGTTKITNGWNYIAPSTCKSGASNNDCQVDVDANMIPVKYAGSEGAPQWQVADPNAAGWYDYGSRQWANAVTVKADKLATYKGQVNAVINTDDILGYWVYIPRYAYEVQRRDATDRFQPEQNIFLRFQKVGDTKMSPATSCNAGITTADQMWANGKADNVSSNVLAKPYRTGCGISRIYGQASGTTWSTHPAFTFGDKELNGIWVGKFETTGTLSNPTILPNKKHLAVMSTVSTTMRHIASYYLIAKSLGVEDANNTAGATDFTPNYNNNNLSSYKSHMAKNSEWGAMAYLSASVYGTGPNGVQINANNSEGVAGNGEKSIGITGCGPQAVDNREVSSTCNTYDSALGQTASTTGNVYGVYDTSGGAWEYVMGVWTTLDDGIPSKNTFFGDNGPKLPYVNLYRATTSGGFGAAKSWSASANDVYYEADNCTYESCGGDATYETRRVQSATDSDGESWYYGGSQFAHSSGIWMTRSGPAGDLSDSIFYTSQGYGGTTSQSGCRVVMIAD